ncbi:MAG: AraC family transcriptional regulator [Clostridia bacterium]|nr:AraC family transcriptional regulator [Clostridia bacterium]
MQNIRERKGVDLRAFAVLRLLACGRFRGLAWRTGCYARYVLELLKKDASVTEACTAAGFSDCSHFIVLFKKKFGETPLKYKKRIES